ncbi:hypothetical protein B0H19DRAFT_1154447 [Mycena capillaripes]|nr:hypothetical protein B0H19DRAFT_1154447 [Mycena capillaripes]
MPKTLLRLLLTPIASHRCTSLSPSGSSPPNPCVVCELTLVHERCLYRAQVRELRRRRRIPKTPLRLLLTRPHIVPSLRLAPSSPWTRRIAPRATSSALSLDHGPHAREDGLCIRYCVCSLSRGSEQQVFMRDTRVLCFCVGEASARTRVVARGERGSEGESTRAGDGYGDG